MLLILRPIRLALKALITEATPNQLAWGFALGVLIGLVPKGNLIAISLGIILAASRANLGVAAATILACSFLSPMLDPASDVVGGWLLSHPDLQSMWTSLYNKPLMPWTDFNNTVVLGSLTIGVLALYPLYRISHLAFDRYVERVSNWAKKFWLVRVLMGLEVVDRLTLSE